MDQRVWLLACGVAAGPIYIIVGAMQIAIRPGFDPTRHALSLLSNGHLGWIQISNFLITGGLLIAGAIGMKKSLVRGVGRTWAPRMVIMYGVGLIGAGLFRADPGRGFPPGASLTHNTITWHGEMHFVAGSIGFIGLIASTIIFALRFRNSGQTGWAVSSIMTGIVFLTTFVGIASGASGPINLLFSAAVVVSFLWLSAIFGHILRASSQDLNECGKEIKKS